MTQSDTGDKALKIAIAIAGFFAAFQFHSMKEEIVSMRKDFQDYMISDSRESGERNQRINALESNYSALRDDMDKIREYERSNGPTVIKPEGI